MFLNELNTVTPAQSSGAASSLEMSSGILATASVRRMAYSACPPSVMIPIERSRVSGVGQMEPN